MNDQVRAIWDANAAFWDERMGEGNAYHKQLLEPTILRLLELEPDARVLEIACGNGQLARQLASLGARVVATDFSTRMLERAAAHASEFAERITFRLVDATNEQELRALGANEFDAIVCNMAIMDMSEIDPLFRAVPALLAPRGRFIFSVTHPCFNSTYSSFSLEMQDREGEMVETRTVKLSGYITARTNKGLAMIGQPLPQYYFHRPLSVLFNSAFRAGLVMDALEEPTFDPTSTSPRWFSWQNYHEFPPFLVARLRIKD